VRILLADVVPHEPPAVVRVSVTDAGAAAAAVYVVVFGVAPPLFVNDPPAPPSLHTADVAPPPNEPPRAAVVPPWQIAATAPPALTVGNKLTVMAKGREEPRLPQPLLAVTRTFPEREVAEKLTVILF
jgi:hypothetical protein